MKPTPGEFSEWAKRCVLEIMTTGEATHNNADWTELVVPFHRVRAQLHLLDSESGSDSEPHLLHAACRALMAAWIEQSMEQWQPE